MATCALLQRWPAVACTAHLLPDCVLMWICELLEVFASDHPFCRAGMDRFAGALMSCQNCTLGLCALWWLICYRTVVLTC